ncbi:hydroxypyruvate isomerase [Microbacterium sp. cf046]|uniref:sugar phosphate isomerase/epimerase family protein n=1 Tax=Microbacterium sp. cf046 TaxID=1761803 RepID=UPI0008E1162C|nr:sugar phosphate isomerase/epimerase family protein [Microbacterium sp. cf046]SFS12892.1 hydroxypyruvate isomerase [Microbacterium sp. cf046]
MYELAPNIEVLFAESDDYSDRVRAAAAAGFTAVEMWGPRGHDYPSRPKDLPALKAALDDTGARLTLLTSEPRTHFMIPPMDHSAFYSGLDDGVEVAHLLGCPRIVVSCGTAHTETPRQTQLDLLAEVFRKATTQIEGSNVTLVLEAVNTRVDHPGMLIDRTREAVYVARQVDSHFFGVLYDVYHSSVEGEHPPVEIADAGSLIRYVQFADAPGRGAPGTGTIDWFQVLTSLRRAGYDGPIGLESLPSESQDSLDFIRDLVAAAS